MNLFTNISRHFRFQFLIVLFLVSTISPYSFAQQPSIAQKWSEKLLFALENDFARPTIQSRYIFHAGIAMYDSWAAYDSTTNTYLLGNTVGAYSSSFDGISIPVGPEAIHEAREETMSFAMYRLIKHYFIASPGFFYISMDIDDFMTSRNYNTFITSVNYQNGGAAELGNYIAQEIIQYGYQDGSNEVNGYWNQYYIPQNAPLLPFEPGNPQMSYPNKWQPLTYVSDFIGGFPEYFTPPFLSTHWGNVQPFALSEENLETFEVDDNLWNVYHNPGTPPLLDTTEHVGLESPLKWGTLMTSVWQSHHDPDLEIMWDISPGAMGNIESYPESWEEYPDFYNFFDGGDNSTGHPLNPVTTAPYENHLMNRGEYTRALAVFWNASYEFQSIPAKWLYIANEKVLNHPDFERNWMGGAEIMDTLAFDVKFYLTLGGALHDAAITAWSIKAFYESPRPVSAIRYMAERGQCSDTTLANYHPAGLPLLDGHIEMVSPDDALAGDVLEHLGKIKLNTWHGLDFTDSWGGVNPQIHDEVKWILAENWFPFQKQHHISPSYAAYVSGQTLFSSVAATVLAQVTGNAFFPGGLAQFEVSGESYPYIEFAPEENVVLQYATYRDAADQCGLSRIWGGVNTPFADIPARVIGQTVGEDAVTFANALFGNDVVTSVPAVLNAPDLTVFPNPAAKGEMVNVHTNQTLTQVVISLANSKGQIIHRQENGRLEKGIHTLHVTDLPSGLYILHLQSAEGVRTTRVVVR